MNPKHHATMEQAYQCHLVPDWHEDSVAESIPEHSQKDIQAIYCQRCEDPGDGVRGMVDNGDIEGSGKDETRKRELKPT
jgi:hypothetical protein